MSTPNKRYNFVNLNRNFLPNNVKNKLLYSTYGESNSLDENVIKNIKAFNELKQKKKNGTKSSHYPKALIKYDYNKNSTVKNIHKSIFPKEAFTESSQPTESITEINENNKSSDDNLYKDIHNILFPVDSFKLPSKQNYDLSIQPKVFVQYIPRKGEIPRKIVIERTKKKYASINIAELLLKNGITSEDLYNLLLPNNIPTENLKSKYSDSLKIPLEYFDNTEYESRTIEEWLNINRNPIEIPNKEKGDTILFASIPLPAIAFEYPEWRECYVTGYNYENDLWNIKWKETSTWYVEENISNENEDKDENIIDSMLENSTDSLNIKNENDNNTESIKTSIRSSENKKKNIWISRLRFCFKAENPEKYVERVMHAINEKEKAKKIIKYNFYVDCMSINSSLSIPEKMLKKINEYLLKNKIISTNTRNHSLINELEKEIDIDYKRSSNKNIFDQQVKKNEFKNILNSIEFPEKSLNDNPKEYGKIIIPNSDFPINKCNFSFITYLSKAEIIDSFVKIKDECNKLLNQCSFVTPNSNKTVKVEEFEQIQLQSFNLIKSSAIEKKNEIGWYNIYESNVEVYNISKFKKFMTTVRFIMQDTLRYLILNSLDKYLEFFSIYNYYSIKILSINNVKLIPYDKNNTNINSNLTKPIFNIDLINKNGSICYNIEKKEIVKTILQLFDKSLLVIDKIPQMESIILKNIAWSSVEPLDTVGNTEKIVKTKRILLKEKINFAIQQIEAYLKLYEKFIPMLNFDIDKFKEEYENNELKSLEEIESDIIHYKKEWEIIEENIPSSIDIGIFHINCENIKAALKKDLPKIILSILNKKTADEVQNISKEYSHIAQKLKEKPLKIEDICNIREYIATVPDLIHEEIEKYQKVVNNYDILEKYRYELSADESKLKWNVMAWPNKIYDAIDNTNEVIYVEEQAFLKNLQGDQEQFTERIQRLGSLISELSIFNDISRINDYISNIHKAIKELKECQNQAVIFNSREALLNLPITNYDDINQLAVNFEPYKNLWLTVYDWGKWKNQWMNGSFNELQSDNVEKDVNNSWRMMLKLIKHFKNMEDKLKIATKIKDEIEDFKKYMPLIQSLRNPGVNARHWEEISKELNMKIEITDKTTLQNLLDYNLLDKLPEITKVCDIASKEYAIQEALEKMKNEWQDQNLDILPYKDTGTFIVHISEETLRLLDDHIVMTQSMSFSPYKKPFEEEISNWEGKLKTIQNVLEEWMACQRSWLYLEPIFSSDDIIQQLPSESKRFRTMDRMWRKNMIHGKENPNIIEFCSNPNLLKSFCECNKLLDMVSKHLSTYLESKRYAFPRFFFLSDDELLQILSQTKDPTAVQPHLRKCFENIMRLEFGKDNLISAMYSAENECINFNEPFIPKGNIEDWLSRVELTMKESIKEVINKGLIEYHSIPRNQWVLNWPGQVIISVTQIIFTAEVTEVLDTEGARGLPNYFQKLLNQLQDLVKLVRGDLSYISRLILSDLIIMDVHSRDIVKTMIESQVSNTNDFEWISQLRYYWENEDLKVRIVNAEFNYGYEYLGNTGRLVITPLTDRCYLTLCGAMHLGMGGAPAGPAGTGKTETCKDLAKALAKQCVVFNCSDQLDYLAMGKFFKGLASAGAWACFDEFNRIDIEVLSVIAQQISTIQKAAAANLKEFIFEGVELKLDKTNAIFITMNPGYAGRTELPDNLKALFRPVAMMIPDYTMIAEISLFSFGFSDARVLAEKMVATFKLSSEQLSSQDHYDFGMRAVKTVISSAGNLKRSDPETPEAILLLRSLCDVNIPKFVSDDIPLFNGIISDLFPGITKPKIDYGSLLESIKQTCQRNNIQDIDVFIEKCIQLYETTIVRHGLMLVGPTGGGKTTCYRILSEALTSLSKNQKKRSEDKIYQAIHTHVLNPKSITMGQLYGEFDLQTHEWTDGILSYLVRQGVADESSDKHWYIFDGPVDAIWIESMNTVLDDNKKLCLSSGEIIKLNPTQLLIFEVEDLAFASPATVSRCGMIYIEPVSLGINPLIDSWINEEKAHLPENYKDSFEKRIRFLFASFINDALEFLRNNIKESIPTSNGNLVQSLSRIIHSMIAEFMIFYEENINSQDTINIFNEEIDPIFLYSLIWSVGVTSDMESRIKFDCWLKNKLSVVEVYNKLPNEEMVYDYQYNFNERKWINWLEKAPEFVAPNTSEELKNTIIPTIDTIRLSYLLEILKKQNYNIICTGPTGTGKTSIIMERLLKNGNDKYMPIIINFSARTNANQIQDLLDSKMEKRRKGIYGPPLGKNYIIFIDDLNMPMLDVCNAQPPIELIRQWMDHGGWYDLKSVGSFMTIKDINFICAMGPPGGGRNPVTPRLTRHFNLISFTEMEDNSLNKIFKTVLDIFLGKISQDILLQSNAIVNASIHVYNTIRNELLPTPAKSHYTFNLRDLAKVIHGLLNADPKTTTLQEDIYKLWIHECLRVFQDRLVNEDDREWFTNLIKSTTSQFYNIEYSSIVQNEPLIYGDYLVPNAETRVYAEVKDLNKLGKLMEDYLEEYNNLSNSPLKLVMFLDAIEHVSRICRIIRQTRGNALLLGIGGSGRQSLSRLASYMEEYDIFQIELSKNYGINEWHDDIKKVMMKAGLESRDIVFLFSDTQIVMESCLEDINNMLNTGDVPMIYSVDEMENILNTYKQKVIEAGEIPTRENIFSKYVNNVQNHLHIILCMSPIGEVFRNRLRMFPSFVNCSTIDWFSMWPEDALRSVAINTISDISDLGPEDVIDGIVDVCVTMHESVRLKCIQYENEIGRFNYITPKSYLELLNLYKILLQKKRNELYGLRKRTATGLDKLLSAAKEVEVLQNELKAMQPLLLQTSKEVEETMVNIDKDKKDTQVLRENIAKEEELASQKADETKAIADDAKRDLDEALPLLANALNSLKTLSKGDITEVKSMQRPPEGVKLVIEAVCIMKEVKPKKVDGDKIGKKVDDYWEPGKQLLSDPTRFIDSLMNYDKDNIPDAVINKIKPYIDNPNFKKEVIERVSKAATSMCLWVRAMEKYYWVSKVVKPKREKLKEAEESLKETVDALNQLKKRLNEADEHIKEMELKFIEMTTRKKELADKVEECNIKLTRASKLITGLENERERWSSTVTELDVLLKNIIGDILISAGEIAYLGNFTPEYRSDLKQLWNELLNQTAIPHSESTSLWSNLGDPVVLREWELFGLPKDSLSRDNAIIIKNSQRWPLLIDPQGQANKWIRNMESENGLEIIKLSDREFLRSLENAIRFGKPVLLENVDEVLDPALEPILAKKIYKQGGNSVIKLGDNVLQYHNDFRFYITSKLPNPKYSPELSATLTLVNFTLTPIGLEDQLLALVVINERPDLEEAKNSLVASNAQMKQELKEIEDKILFLLSSVEGSPVDDERLIDTLAASKETSAEIKEKMAAAEITEQDIDQTRNKYKPVAIRTQILFFCITELSIVDPMYQYSLNWFMNLFTNAIEKSEKSNNIEARVSNINDYFTYSLFCNVCNSLFEKHKLMFSLLLTIRILSNEGKINMDEWRFLLSGNAMNDEKRKPNPAPEWISNKIWTDICSLSTLPNYENFDEDFIVHLKEFKKIFDSQVPQREILPGKWRLKLDTFQKLLVLRCLREDKITSGIQDFVSEMLGEQFVEPRSTALSSLFVESNAITPIIFILSAGADPATSLYKFAEEMKFSKKLTTVSLGQGQGPRAEKLITDGMEKGQWVLLQNCHLSPSWMPKLDHIIDGFTFDKVNKDFRLWLTSMPTDKFPVAILQNGVKSTVEPSKGLKANLLRTYTAYNEEYLNSSSKIQQWKKLLFSLSFFHAIVQERRKFGSLGWNIPYEFTDGDLQICTKQLNMYLNDYDEIPYKVLKYIIGEINYGGRVTDNWDRRLIMNILEDFINPKVLVDGHKFSHSPIYYSIPGDTYKSYINYIKSLPLEETTDVFSMHENANITFAQQEAQGLFNTLLMLMPKQTQSSNGKSRDEQITETVQSIQQRIPQPFNLKEILIKYPIDYNESMSTVLTQEVVRFNRLITVIHSTLKDLIKAIKGLVVMSKALEEMENSIYLNKVPALWEAKAYPSLKSLSSWVDDLIARIEFLQQWIDNGIPKVFWISGFFFPQAFLTGTLQNFARKYVISIDSLSFGFKVIDKPYNLIDKKPVDGCYIRGLYLDGARWDSQKGALNEAFPKTLYSEMPVIWLLPVRNRVKPVTDIYECPVYKTLTRAGTLSTTGHSTNYVLTIEIPSNHPQSHWIKRGVALICSLGSGW
ncbi:dynein heavy chain and region D6 of dynein motor-domain-containing protein [Neocallimastix sp. 'constans']